jgi:hypothetical protein
LSARLLTPLLLFIMLLSPKRKRTDATLAGK